MPAPRTTVRPAAGIRAQLSPAEIALLREKLVREQAARPPGSRTSGRPPARRSTATRKPSKRTTAARRKAARTAARTAARAERGRRWSRPLVVAPLGILLVAGALCVVLPGSSTQPTDGRDVTGLALTAKATLVEQADHYRALERVVAARRLDLGMARESQQAAAARVAARRAVVGRAAAELYSAVPGSAYAVGTTAAEGAAHDAAVSAAAAVRAPLARAQEATAALDAAAHRVALATRAVAAATARADDALAASRSTVAGLSPQVVVRLASLDVVPASSAERARNAAAVHRWQSYLASLAGADITPPSAADLTDADDLPSGLSSVLDRAGKPVPGIALGVVGNRPVPVLPAETVAAVSTALSQLGKPYASGTSGPSTYDCGGFTAANWLLAGYALPATPAAQLGAGTPIAMNEIQVGDLVLSPGGRDVGIYLGDGDVIGASAKTHRVTIRGVLAGSTAVRVTVPRPGSAATVAGVARTGTCGAPLRHGSYDDPAWGGYRNGQIPPAALCGLGVAHHVLRCDAAASYREMAKAYVADLGSPMCITDSYRPLGAQVDAFSRKPELAAVPGTSNHGWALAVDLCGGIASPTSPEGRWMAANAGRFGFVNPDWAAPHGEKPEPWHWEYGYIS